MIKFKFLILILFLHCHTYRYYFHNSKPLVENNTNLANTQQKKVGLVGFYKYIYLPSTRYYEFDLDFLRVFYKYNPLAFKADLIRDKTQVIHTYEPYLAKESEKKKVRFGNDYKEFTEQGFDEGVTEKKIAFFAMEYLEDTNRNAQTEFSNLIKIKNKDAKFIKRDIDYYVVGIFNPSSPESTNLGILAKTISSLLSIPTFLTIPFLDRESMYSRFLIFDNKLNLKKEFKYEDSYWTMNAWWIKHLGNKKNIVNADITELDIPSYPPQFYLDKEVEIFSKDLEDFLHAEK